MPDEPGYREKPGTEGWTKRFSACEPRLSEAVTLYKESGFEVFLANIPSKQSCDTCNTKEEISECRVCFDGVEDQYKIIYTRPQKSVSKT